MSTLDLTMSGTVFPISACYRGPRLVGHILEHSCTYEVHSWPDEILIGVFSSIDQAVAAVIAAEHNSASDMDEEIKLTLVPAPQKIIRGLIPSGVKADSFRVFSGAQV